MNHYTSGETNKISAPLYGVLSVSCLIHVLLAAGLVSIVFTGLSVADSGISGESQEARQAESRAEKRALIVTDEYIIGPEDILEISVWRTPELSREVVVRPDGRISLPLIGEVMVVGSTTSELRDDITEKLKVYKENPTVAIIVKAIKSYYFTVQGAIGGGGGLEGGGGGGGKIPHLTPKSIMAGISGFVRESQWYHRVLF